MDNVILQGMPFSADGFSFRGAEPAADRQLDGILALDKPEGMTSFGAVARIKKWLRLKKVGHCGTLDPFATGVLVVCLGRATRIADQFQNQDKVYRFTVRLGVETNTLDRTGETVRIWGGSACSAEEIENALHCFRGSYLQQVPRYAAVRVDGKHLYEWSRKGVQVDLPSREVQIHRLELLAYHWPEARLEVHCSKGTYVRQLTADIGGLLGCGAHVSQLRRVASGSFRIEQAVPLEDCAEMLERDVPLGRIIAMNDALAHLPAIRIEEQSVVKRLCDGQLDSSLEDGYRKRFPHDGTPVRLVDGNKCLVALWWPREECGGGRRRLRVLRHYSGL
jgi:tRNA pseudouridine55 synthase